MFVLDKPCPFEVNSTKIGHIPLFSNLNVIIGITSYYYVILKMVILHDAIKTIQNGVCFFLKNEQKPVSFQRKQKHSD